MKVNFSFLKKLFIVLFVLLGVLAASKLDKLQFSFDFSQFFPEEDPDLAFYDKYVEEFGTDDNFLLIAVKNYPDVFQQDFLNRFKAFSEESKSFIHVLESSSLTSLSYPLKTSFGYTTLPIIHVDDSSQYQKDWSKIKEDSLFINVLVDKNKTSLVLALQTEDNLDYKQSELLLNSIRTSLKAHNLPDYHILGRAFFYEAIVEMQKSEVLTTTIVASILVFIILLLVYRSLPVVLISVFSIALSLLLFMGLLGWLGKELNAMAAFYPVLMLIVGTSDVIHLTDSYIRKLQSNIPRYAAITSSLKEVGMTTLLTSVTTAVGFVTLLSSRLVSIQEFGINAAIGVLVAYITVIFLTGSLLIFLPEKSLIGRKSISENWVKYLLKLNTFTKNNPKSIIFGTVVFTILCVVGIYIVQTNQELKNTLPAESKIAKDFDYFQQNYSGFRPLEIAVMSSDGNKVTDFKVAQEIEKLLTYLKTFKSIGNVQSANLPYKIFNKANNLNSAAYFTLPTRKRF